MKIKYLITVFLFTGMSLFAQEGKLELTLQKSIDIALEQNNDIKKARYDLDIARERVSEAYGTSLFPSIDGSINYRRAVKKPVFLIETPLFSGSFESGSDNTMTLAVDAEQPLFTGAMFLAVRIAKTYEDYSKMNVEYGESDLVVQVKSAYYDVLLAEELVQLGELNLEQAKSTLDDTESMYNAGLVSEYDHLKAKVQYQNLVPALTEMKNQRQLAKNNLRITMGVELDREIVIDDSLEYNPFAVYQMENARDMLVQNNELLKQMELNAKLQDLNASYEFTKYFPDITLTANYQAQAQEEDEKPFSRWFYANAWFVGVNVRMPIFTGFSRASQIEQAELEHKKALEDLDKTEKTLKNQLENTLLSIDKNIEQIEAYELAVEEAEKGYDISVKRFNAGLGTQLEVTSSQVTFIQTKVNYLTAIRDYYVNLARLDQLVGKAYTETN